MTAQMDINSGDNSINVGQNYGEIIQNIENHKIIKFMVLNPRLFYGVLALALLGYLSGVCSIGTGVATYAFVGNDEDSVTTFESLPTEEPTATDHIQGLEPTSMNTPTPTKTASVTLTPSPSPSARFACIVLAEILHPREYPSEQIEPFVEWPNGTEFIATARTVDGWVQGEGFSETVWFWYSDDLVKCAGKISDLPFETVPTPTPSPTVTPTNTPTPTPIPTSTNTSTPTPVPTDTPVTPTDTPTPIPSSPSSIEVYRSSDVNGLELVVTKVEVLPQFASGKMLRYHLTVNNRTNDTITLPVSRFTAFDNNGSNYEIDLFGSAWPRDFPSGTTISGSIDLISSVSANASSMTVGFSTIFGSLNVRGSILIPGVPVP